MRRAMLAGLLTLALSACGHNGGDKVAGVSNVMLAPPSLQKLSDVSYDRVAEPQNNNIDTSKKLLKEGEISFETSNIQETRSKILHALGKLRGYLSEENQTNNRGDNQKTVVLKLRVPSKNFDLLLDSVSSGADKIDSKNVTIKDVTAQYIDIKTALVNKKLLENRYLELLKKTNNISDILQIENKLTSIRTEIDSTTGELNYLNKQIAYSILTVNFYTHKIPEETGYGVGYKFKSALSAGWGWLQEMFFGLIGLWPLLLFVTLIYLLVKRWRKKRKTK